MAIRFILTFLSILIYIGLWGPIILLSVPLLKGMGPLFAIGAFVLCFVLIIFGMIFPVFQLSAILFWRFHSQEKIAISEQELRRKILSINTFDVPVMIKEEGMKLIATWKYVDAKWWEVFRKVGMSEMYTLVIRLNDEKKKATLIDIIKTVEWGAGPTGVRISGGFFRGIGISYKIGKAWGIKENFSLGKIYNYEFDSTEIKNPIMNEILKSGWDVGFSMW